jgi:hypothetical protein
VEHRACWRCKKLGIWCASTDTAHIVDHDTLGLYRYRHALAKHTSAFGANMRQVGHPIGGGSWDYTTKFIGIFRQNSLVLLLCR